MQYIWEIYIVLMGNDGEAFLILLNISSTKFPMNST